MQRPPAAGERPGQTANRCLEEVLAPSTELLASSAAGPASVAASSCEVRRNRRRTRASHRHRPRQRCVLKLAHVIMVGPRLRARIMRSHTPLAARRFPLAATRVPTRAFHVPTGNTTAATGNTCGDSRYRLGARGGNSPGRLGHQGGASLAPLGPSPLARRTSPGATRPRDLRPPGPDSPSRDCRVLRHFLRGPFLL